MRLAGPVDSLPGIARLYSEPMSHSETLDFESARAVQSVLGNEVKNLKLLEDRLGVRTTTPRRLDQDRRPETGGGTGPQGPRPAPFGPGEGPAHPAS